MKHTVFGALALAAAFGLAPAARAECEMSFQLTNNDPQEISVLRIQIKVRGGVWKNIQFAPTPMPKNKLEQIAQNYSGGGYTPFLMDANNSRTLSNTRLPFACDSRRRIQVDLMCSNGQILTRYYPSEDGWFTYSPGTVVDINIGGRCKSTPDRVNGEIEGRSELEEATRNPG